MLTEKEREALRCWYGEEEILAEFRRQIEKEEWEELEEHLQMRCLFPLSRHFALPDYLRDEKGGPLFPTNLNPGQDLEKWRDAIEVGWEVIREEFGLEHDEIHRRIAREQQEDWAEFLKSAEERKKDGG